MCFFTLLRGLPSFVFTILNYFQRIYSIYALCKGSRKKSGPTTKEKGTFFIYYFLFVAMEKKFLMTTKPGGGG